MSENISINLDDMTIGDLETFEEITGITMAEAFNTEYRPAAVVKAMAYIAKRKDDPNVTLEDVSSIKLSELNISDDDSEDDEAEGAEDTSDPSGGNAESGADSESDDAKIT